jgi:hypothetical protein
MIGERYFLTSFALRGFCSLRLTFAPFAGPTAGGTFATSSLARSSP